jgi:hypothetical protein
MSEINIECHHDNPPAFPRVGFVSPEDNEPISGNLGMTLRDYFAAAASEDDIRSMAEMHKKTVPNSDLNDGFGPDYKYPSRAKCRYLHADAMLAARKEGA